MTLKRRKYSPAEEVSLTTQVDGCCPLCYKELFYSKASRSFKGFELAHIYPLNPTEDELEELKDVSRLHEDPNNPENLIPLCGICHPKFDKPRTRGEYEELYDIKYKLIERDRQRALIRIFPLENDIQRIIGALSSVDFSDNNIGELSLDAKMVDEKLNETMPQLTHRKIKRNVEDYYQHVFRGFRNLEQQSPAKSQVIYTQVKAFYLKQKSLELPQNEIFQNVVEWIRACTKPETVEAPEIIAAFFVQNCEVFE